MDSSTNASNQGTWLPAWARDAAVNYRLRPYSTAARASEGSRAQPELWDICKGCILWLPSKDAVSKLLDPTLSNRHPAFFNHPVLVLDIEVTDPRNGTVRFANMTKLSLRDIPRPDREHYLPIYPTEPHQDGRALLHLENERPKRCVIKNSCVSISDGTSSVNFKALQCYAVGQKADGYRYRLKRESFEHVVRDLGCDSSAWIETTALWETFLDKHVPTEAEEAVPTEVEDGSA